MISIRQGVYEDIPRIQTFIDEHWQKDHIFVRNRDFFEWQFLNADSKLNMIIAENPQTGNIYGIVGVILYNESENPDASGTMFTVIKSENPMLAIDISDYLYSHFNTRYVCSPGLRPKAVKMNKLLGCKIAKMDHYYRLNDIDTYHIANIKDRKLPAIEDSGFALRPISSVKEMKSIISEQALMNGLLSKSYSYIEKRYFEHPIYKYDIWGISEPDKEPVAVLITREENVGSYKACKIIDYYGDNAYLGKITYSIDRLMKEKEYEFVDVYSFGVPREIYEEAGFVACDDEDDNNIIPNYYHPFEQRNIPRYLVDIEVDGVRLFRGDGDQDRPC